MHKPKSKNPELGVDPARAQGRRTLLLITLLFLVPVVLATGLYFGGWRPQGKALHHGELVQPAQPLTDVVLSKTDGTEYHLNALRGSWTFITFSRMPCKDACRNNLYKMQQVRLTTGKDAGRVQRVFITLANSYDLSALGAQYPGLLVLTGLPDELQKMSGQFAGRDSKSFGDLEHVYLVDPLGNLVLRYSADADPSGMRKDLARLLRLSQIG